MHSSLRSSFFALISAALLAGCASGPLADPVRNGPFFAPSNHVGDPSLGGIRRVVLLPICGGTVAPAETVAAFDPIFVSALQKENRFEVVTLSREDALRKFRVEEFSSVSALPHGFLAALQQEFAADAVLFVDVTTFSAYRPLAIGLRSKLASIDGERLIWSFDNVFSAEDASVANAARRHFLPAGRKDAPGDFTHSALQSPSRFAGYAATAMFSTLPLVVLPTETTKTAISP